MSADLHICPGSDNHFYTGGIFMQSDYAICFGTIPVLSDTLYRYTLRILKYYRSYGWQLNAGYRDLRKIPGQPRRNRLRKESAAKPAPIRTMNSKSCGTRSFSYLNIFL